MPNFNANNMQNNQGQGRPANPQGQRPQGQQRRPQPNGVSQGGVRRPQSNMQGQPQGQPMPQQTPQYQQQRGVNRLGGNTQNNQQMGMQQGYQGMPYQQQPQYQQQPYPQQQYQQYGQQGYMQDEFISDDDMLITDGKGMRPKKKKGKLFLIIIIVIIALVVVAAIKKKNSSKPVETPEEQTSTVEGADGYTGLLEAFRNGYDAEKMDALVGTADGDSYLAQEWAFANHVPLREEFLKTVGQQTDIVPIEGSDGMVRVKVPDFGTIYSNMMVESNQLKLIMDSAGYDRTDYTISDELVQVMLQYILDREGGVPMKEVEVKLPTTKNADGRTIIADDSELDKAMFCQPEIRECDKLCSQVCLEWVDHKTEVYYEQEEQRNPEYDTWYEIFKKYYDEDGGKFTKNSKWEPWYLRDDNNNIQLDENGEKIVNYYSVKDADGNDWIQPDEYVLVEVEKTRDIPIEWVDETGIMYNWIGAWYIRNEYNGKGSKQVPVGNGTIEYPAGVGTPILTHVLCTDGTYATVMVTLNGYWINEDAINYAEQFSTRNRGFTTTSVVQLICCEFTVQNLEQKAITFANSELVLCDKNANPSARTGFLYGFTGEVTLQPAGKKYSTIVMNDWYSSTELEQKYLCWGRSFGRQFPAVYYNALAGTGVVPSYSAYDQFTQPEAQLKNSSKRIF